MAINTEFSFLLRGTDEENLKLVEFVKEKFSGFWDSWSYTEFKKLRTGKLMARSISKYNANFGNFKKCEESSFRDFPELTISSYEYPTLFYVVEFSREIATKMKIEFDMSGMLDASESDGTCMKFTVSCKDGKLSVASSEWWLDIDRGQYEDAEEFNEVFGTELTEDEFKDFSRKYRFYVLRENGKCTVVKEIPLVNTEEYTL